MIIDGVDYLDEDMELFGDGKVHDATLARDTLIQGLRCAGGRSVVYFPSGKLRLAWLAEPMDIQDIPCSPGIFYLHENGTLRNGCLAKDTLFEHAQIQAGTRVTLGADGGLLEYSQRLNQDTTIAGLPFSAAFLVWLYPNGQPSSGVIPSPTIIDGSKYERGSELFLDKSGKVVESRKADLDSGRRYKQRVFGFHEASWV